MSEARADAALVADNPLPSWWTWMFGLVTGAALLYWLAIESFGIVNDPLEAYNAARLAALDTGEPVTEADLAALAADKITLADGEATFARHCARCHGAKGQGILGPNLTDAFWLGGATGVDIFETIYRGRAGKGMQAWGPTLGRGGVMAVTAHVLTLLGTELPGKEPQGTLVPEAPEE